MAIKRPEASILELPKMKDGAFKDLYANMKIPSQDFGRICDCLIKTKDEVVILSMKDGRCVFSAPKYGLTKSIDSRGKSSLHVSVIQGVSNGVAITPAGLSALKQTAELGTEIELLVPTNDPTLPVVAECALETPDECLPKSYNPSKPKPIACLITCAVACQAP